MTKTTTTTTINLQDITIDNTQPTIKPRSVGWTSLVLAGTAGVALLAGAASLASSIESKHKPMNERYMDKVKQLALSTDPWLSGMYNPNYPEAKKYMDDMANKFGTLEARAKETNNTQALVELEALFNKFEEFMSPNEELIYLFYKHKLLCQKNIDGMNSEMKKMFDERIYQESHPPTKADKAEQPTA